MKKAIIYSLTSIAVAALVAPSAFAERYIVKFAKPATFQTMSANVKKHQELLEQLGIGPVRQGVQLFNTNAQVSETLDNLEMAIVDGSEMDMNLLSQNGEIAYIEEDTLIPAPALPLHHTDTPAENLPITQNPWGIDNVKAPAVWAMGYSGEGVRVMVLDTGVDKDHPALAANFEKGQDFVGDNNGPYPFFDSMGHGTHVSGTILADGVTTGLHGVAPRAKLLMGRVCGSVGCYSSSILAGVNWAITEGVDVVNMSLGGPFPSPSGREAYARADAAGVMVIAASGNDGAQRVSYPAAYETVFAVGAIDNTNTKADFSNWGPQLDLVAPGVSILSSVPQGMGTAAEVILDLGNGPVKVNSLAMDGSAVVPESIEGEFVPAGLGKPEDFQGVDMQGKIALIHRGEIAFGDKARNAINAGAIAVVIYNNADGLALGTLNGQVNVPVVMIEQAVGLQVIEKIAEKTEPYIGRVGTVPSDYLEFAGTSMASPHAAGVAALVRNANPNLTPAQVRQVLRETAIPHNEGNANNEYGQGIINAEAAVQRALN